MLKEGSWTMKAEVLRLQHSLNVIRLIQTLDRELKRVSDEYSSKCLAFLAHKLLSFIPTLLGRLN